MARESAIDAGTQREAGEAQPRPPGSGPQPNRDYIWLVYSVFFFIDPVLRHSRTFWLECFAIYAVFIFIYVGCMRARTSMASALWAGGFTILGLIAYPINSGSSTFFIYTAAILPLCIPKARVVIWSILALTTLVVLEGWFFHINRISIGSTVIILVAVGVANFFVGEQKLADCKLRRAHEEIEQLAALAERERIARDLHDVLGHTLSLIVLKAELAGRLLREGPSRDAERAAREVADVETAARSALQEVRETIGGYRSQGLAAELERARRTLDVAGVSLCCEAGIGSGVAMTPAQETVLTLAVREAVTNIVRHAGAAACRVSVQTEGGYHTLRVEDDGVHRGEREGNGLRGMRERVDALGGMYTLETGDGTRLLIRLPAMPLERA